MSRDGDGRASEPRARAGAVVLRYGAIGALAVILAVNVTGMAVSPEDLADHVAPVHHRADPDVLAIAESHGNITLRDRVVIYLRLGRVADGRPVVSYPGALDPYDVLGLSRTDLVVDEGYERDLTAEEVERLSAYPAFESAPQQHGRWTIVPATDVAPGPALRVLRHDGRLYIVDEAVLAEVAG